MPNMTPDEYWSVIPSDGIEYSLQTYAKNIETWGDDRQGVPGLRGDDWTVPWIPGDQEVTRVVDSRVITIAGWVLGIDDSGSLTLPNNERQFDANWMLMKRILWNRGRVFTLRKRFYDETGTVRQADARARYAGGLSPSMMGREAARFTVDLKLADPFFYGADTVINIGAGTTTAVILGSADIRKMTIVMNAGAAGVDIPTLQCTETGHTIGSALTGLVSGDQLVIDTAGQYAALNNNNSSALITHSGSSDWFQLAPGTMHLVNTSAVGAWTGTLTYKPTWI